MKPAIKAAIASSIFIIGGCGADYTGSESEEDGTVESAALASHGNKSGKELFEKETFGGNGRTCRTCHEKETGSISPASVQARFAANPDEPLFRALDSDDGVSGASYDRLKTHATVLVNIDLPSYVSLGADPGATQVRLERGVPSTFDKNPALEPVLMYDTRAADLKAQALGAVHAHAEPTIEPTADQLQRIADFEADKLFSSDDLKDFAEGCDAPKLPKGHTASEKRGKRFVDDVPFDPATTGLAGVCSLCHSGPMLNTTKLLIASGIVLQGPGQRVSTAGVSELNDRQRPLTQFLFKLPAGVPVPFLTVIPDFVSVAQDGVTTVALSTPDPGVALVPSLPIIHGDPSIAMQGVNIFKIPSLWNIGKTAPYFHDHSAKTLAELVDHYNRFFMAPPLFFPAMTAQDQADLVAYLKLL